MNTANRFQQINKSVRAGTLPLDNYSGFKPGDRVATRYGEYIEGTVTDVCFQNTPSSALYYVIWKDDQGGERNCYPEQLNPR